MNKYPAMSARTKAAVEKALRNHRPQKPSKYRAKRTTCAHLHKHPSKKEAARCDALHLLERAGMIRELTFQNSYDLVVNGVSVGRYVADFGYLDCKPGTIPARTLEDCKGFRTPVYKLKAKLMKAIYGIEIRET